MKNSNDSTAKYYDIVYADYKRGKVLQEEINLITNNVNSNANILDIGAGTGRHAEILEQLGYKVTTIDSSEALTQIAKSKLKSSYVILDDIYKHDFQDSKFDLIIMMWNVVNEIALNNEDFLNLLKICKDLLNVGGKLIINFDNSQQIQPDKFNVQNSINFDDVVYKQIWKVKSFDKETKITVTEETIEVYKNKILIDKASTEITQRWWSVEEVQNSLIVLKMNSEITSINSNSEIYLIAS